MLKVFPDGVPASREEFAPPLHNRVATTIAVAATYVYYPARSGRVGLAALFCIRWIGWRANTVAE